MKLNKATIYWYDLNNDECNIECVTDACSRFDISMEAFEVDFVEIGEWYDEIDLNNVIKRKDRWTFNRYFTDHKKAITKLQEMVLLVMKSSDITGINIDEAIKLSLEKYLKDYYEFDRPMLLFTEGEISELKETCISIINH